MEVEDEGEGRRGNVEERRMMRRVGEGRRGNVEERKENEIRRRQYNVSIEFNDVSIEFLFL